MGPEYDMARRATLRRLHWFPSRTRVRADSIVHGKGHLGHVFRRDPVRFAEHGSMDSTLRVPLDAFGPAAP